MMAHEEVSPDDTRQTDQAEDVSGEEKDLKYYTSSLWVRVVVYI